MEEIELDLKKQKNTKIISKAIYIIAKIMKIFCIIGIVGISIAIITVPLFTSQIKINDEQIIIGNQEFSYDLQDDSFKLYDGNKTLIDVSITSNIGASKIKKFFSTKTINNISLGLEIVFVCIIVDLVILILLFNKVHKLFKNIHDNHSPFTLENSMYLKNIAYLLLISMVIPIIYNNIMNLICGFDFNYSFSLTNIIILLAIMVLSYIFEYGYNLQKNSKKGIYGDINE